MLATTTVRRVKFCKTIALAGIPLLAAGFFSPSVTHAQTGTAVFNALTRTDYSGTTYSGPSAVDFAGTSTNGTATANTKGRTLMGQSFSAQNLGGSGFQVTTVQFYLWNGSAADGGTTGVNYNNIRANINFYQGSTGEDELALSPGAGVFSAQVGTTLSYTLTAQQVTSVNGTDGGATLITISVPQPTSYSFTRYGDTTDDVNSVNNKNKNFLGITIQLQGDTGAGFGTTNDLSTAIWDKADYQQTSAGKIAMATKNSNTGHPFGGFYRDFDVPVGDPLHQGANFSGLDERSVQGTSFNSLAIALFGTSIAATPEPSTFALALPFLITGGGMVWRRHRTTKKLA